MGSDGHVYQGSKVALVSVSGHTKEEVARALGVVLSPTSASLVLTVGEGRLARFIHRLCGRPKSRAKHLIVGELYSAPHQELELRIDAQYPQLVRRAQRFGKPTWRQM